MGRRTDVGQIDYHLDELSCTDCHNGDSNILNNMMEAHTGLIADPSRYNENGTNACSQSGCHEDIAGQYKNNLHQKAWGERKAIAIRSGFDANQFDQCPSSTKEGFYGECANCHATCGDCHISIPNSAGQGLISNHRFMGQPSSVNNCMACHGSRIAHDFLGSNEFPFRPSDVHASSMNCLDCHMQTEMHSASTEGTDRYQFDQLPSCEDCHNDVADVNTYHTRHIDDLTCYVCHSQDYSNCTDCHVTPVESYDPVNTGWKEDLVYQSRNPEEDFRIGLNPIKQSSGQHRQKFATLRHIPITENSYDNWGEASADLPGYDELPTWKYTSPHSILRFTARTDTSDGKSCQESCHIGGAHGDSANVKYYLTRQYVEQHWPEEVNANESVFVNDNLPGGWE